MRKLFILLLILGVFLISNSCEEDRTGYVTFGANFHVIDCITTVTVYVDGVSLGVLEGFTDAITECHATGNITKELPVGKHSYLVEIRSLSGTGCTKNISGNFIIEVGECEKKFIDYFAIDF